VLKSELVLYNGVDIDWQFEGNVSNTSGESTIRTVRSENFFLTICHFVYHNNNTTDTATMPCSAALIREEPCQVFGTPTV